MALLGGGTNGGGTLRLSRCWPATDAELKPLEFKLGYSFRDKAILRLALIHPSFGEMDNARLTWLGDAVLGAAVSDLLFTALPPNATTELLHNRRMELVRQESFAAGAARLGLQELLVVGKAYEGQVPTARMLAEAFEAVWGALYEDAGLHLSAVKVVYSRLFPLAETTVAAVADGNGIANGSA